MEEDCSQWTCNMCGNMGMADGSDGYFYCLRCGSQADDIIDTGVADEDFVEKGIQGGAVYLASHTRHARQTVIPAQPISQVNPQSQQFWSNLSQDGIGDGMGPSGTSDFGSYSTCAYSYEGYYQEVRNRYVMGLQMMIEAQCEALVEKFNVKPLICGIVGPIWLRFVASTGVFDDDWADEAIHQSEIQKSGEVEDFKPHSRHRAEPHNIHGQRALMVWNKYLRKKIPLSCSLAISFLGCHITREAVLPTDLIKWSVEGELTYFDAFVEIEKRIGQSLPPFPLTLRSMFRPAHAYSAQQLESLAATIAQCIGLNLPPVNFYGIASRYLKELAIPVEKILPHACCIYEWVMPPELRLSANNSGLPTRVYVMSILIVAIRILYDINGLGVWEKSLSSHSLRSRSTEAVSEDPASSPKGRNAAENGFGSPHSVDHLGTSSTRNRLSNHESKFDAAELLRNLEARYNEIYNAYGGVKCTRGLSKSMPSYLQFCQDVVFAGSEPAVDFFHEEKTLIDKLWNYYQEEKGSQPAEGLGEQHSSAGIKYKSNKLVQDNEYHSSPSHDGRTSQEDILTQRHSDVDNSSMTSEKHRNPEPSDKVSGETSEHRAIRLLKKSMEENRFRYIPPRVKLRRLDYLQYVRKRDEGAITYVAHADYYILLRACAIVTEVDMRIMHVGVLGMERRLDWLEKRIDHCLHLTPSTTCKFCSVEPEQATDDHTIEHTNLNLV